MTEQELLRTALILPPRARAVLCVWAAIPGLLCAPFVFWQSLFAGLCFCAVWGLLVLALRLRTPLLWLAGASVLLVHCPGGLLVLPGVPSVQADTLASILTEDAV